MLDASSGLVFRILGLNRESEDRVTAEELHLIVAEASKSGVIEESERAIISGVVRLADRPVREVMTPRIDVDWIDIASDADTVRAKLLETPHTRIPVARGSVDDIVGVVQARDIAAALFRGETLDIERLTARPKSSTTRSTRWTHSKPCASPTCRCCSSTTNMAISKGW